MTTSCERAIVEMTDDGDNVVLSAFPVDGVEILGQDGRSVWCWNALSPANQRLLIDGARGVQVTEADWTAACGEPARVAIETFNEEAPGPRFYCFGCAIERLRALRDDEFRLPTPDAQGRNGR